MATDRQERAWCLPSTRHGKGSARSRPVRAFRSLLLAGGICLAGPSLSHGDESPAAGASPTGGLPSFLFQPFYASNQGSVYGIYEARQADLVLVEGGFDAGFQAGMLCRVVASDGEVGEIMLVEVRRNCSAGLILQLEAGKVIEPGHSVRIKTVTF